MAGREHSQASYVDPQTAIRQLEVKLDVDRRTVEEYFGDYQCECVAWSSRGEKVSDSVTITAACKYLHKERGSAGSNSGECRFSMPLKCLTFVCVVFHGAWKYNLCWSSTLKI